MPDKYILLLVIMILLGSLAWFSYQNVQPIYERILILIEMTVGALVALVRSHAGGDNKDAGS